MSSTLPELRPMPAFRFFLITYLLSWALWLAATLIQRSTSLPAFEILYLPGTIMPALVALFLTRRDKGSKAVQSLVNRIFQWQAGAQWYLFGLTFMTVIKLAAAASHRVITGEWPRFGPEPWYLLVFAIFFSTWVQAGEELGWRGYALPRLAERFGLRGASLLLGVIWAAWHLPLFFIQGADKPGQSFPVYLIQVTALSVAMAWLWQRTNGSLLLVMIMHASVNNSIRIVPPPLEGAQDIFSLNASLISWLTAAVLWIVAGYLLFDMKQAKEIPKIEPNG